MLPDKGRKCRDVLGCLLFFCFFVGMLIVGGLGLQYGKWQRLVYGNDYLGQTCGVDAPVAGSRYVVYPRINQDFLSNYGLKNPSLFTFYGVCAAACPGRLSVVCNYDSSLAGLSGVPTDFKATCLQDTSVADDTMYGPTVTCGGVRSNCWLIPQATASTLFRCIPVYNATNSVSSTCSYPPGVTSPVDPRCLLVVESRAGTIEKPAKPNMLFDQLSQARLVWGRWIGDLARSWWVLLTCAVGISLVLGFLFVNFLKYCTGCMVWSVILLGVGLLAFLTGYFYWLGGLVTLTIPPSLENALLSIPGVAAAGADITSAAGAASSTASVIVPNSLQSALGFSQGTWRIIAYISTAVLVIVLLVVLAVRASINTAIEVIKLGAQALRATPSLVIIPFTNMVALAIFLLWWVFVAACLASSGDNITLTSVIADVQAGAAQFSTDFNVSASFANGIIGAPGVNGTQVTVSDKPIFTWLLVYHFFGLLWSVQFIGGISSLTIAGAVSAWYFSQLPKGSPEELEKHRYATSRMPTCAALWRTLRYHMGSVAIGSLLIALVQLLRAVFAYISRQLSKSAKSNSAARFVLCCVNCLLKCLQMCVEVVTRNAYIYIAIKGEGFLRAGRRVFSLIVAHGKVFYVVNVLGELIMFVGKVLIAIGAAFACFLFLNHLPQFQEGGVDQLSSTWLPILVTLFFAYATAAGFMSLFDLSVDTVLVCYCTDIDENLRRNGGDSRFAVPIHMRKDSFTRLFRRGTVKMVGGDAADAEAAATDAADKGAAKSGAKVGAA